MGWRIRTEKALRLDDQASRMFLRCGWRELLTIKRSEPKMLNMSYVPSPLDLLGCFFLGLVKGVSKHTVNDWLNVFIRGSNWVPKEEHQTLGWLPISFRSGKHKVDLCVP